MAQSESYVIDIQGFKTLLNEFVMKEVCIVGVHSGKVYHIFVKSPVCYENLCEKLKSRVNYITKYIHGIYWNSGSVDENTVVEILQKTVKNASRVYIKGSERVKFLKNLLNNTIPVVDLDIFNFDGNYKIKQVNFSCYYNERHSNLRCALKNACTYKRWLLNHLEKISCI